MSSSQSMICALSVVALALPRGSGQLSALAQCELAKLTAEDGAPGELFGFSVAIYEQTLLVGALRDNEVGYRAGAAYVYERSHARWSATAKLTAEGSAHMGRAVGLGLDRAVAAAEGSATVYVFERTGGGWSRVAELRPDDWEPLDFFALSVAISAERIVVGAPGDNDHGADSGSAYVFERQADRTWSQTAKLTADDGDSYDRFGEAVAIDGDIMVVGAPDDEELGNWSGSAYVFERQPDDTWLQVGKLLADDGAGFDRFGLSVATDGAVLLVGAIDADGRDEHTGAVYVFERGEGDVWTQTTKLLAEDGQSSDLFGHAVALAGNVAVVGAIGDDDLGWGAGSAYVFVRAENGNWSQVAKLVSEDGAREDRFGNSVAASGNIAVVGSYKDDDHGTDSGSAYVFAVGPDDDGDGVMDACECPGDLNHDWIVDYYDLAVLLADWGCTSGDCPGDCDLDGDTDQADLGLLLAYWGEVCP